MTRKGPSEREVMDPYVIEAPFPHVPPGPAETELMDGGAPALLPRSQDVDLVVSAIDILMPWHLRKALKPWSREDLHVRVFQGVRPGGPKPRQVCCRETFDMEAGSLLAREYFDPGKGSTRLPSPALPGCSPCSPPSLCVRSIFWYSELDPVPESICAIAARCRARACASPWRSPSSWSFCGGRMYLHMHKPVRHMCKGTGECRNLSSTPAREAPLLENGGESKATPATVEQITWSCVARKGEEMGRNLTRNKLGMKSLTRMMPCLKRVLQRLNRRVIGLRKRILLPLKSPMVQLGWQNEEVSLRPMGESCGSTRSQSDATDETRRSPWKGRMKNAQELVTARRRRRPCTASQGCRSVSSRNW